MRQVKRVKPGLPLDTFNLQQHQDPAAHTPVGLFLEHKLVEPEHQRGGVSTALEMLALERLRLTLSCS